jgi:hypothetical protein
MKKTLIAAGIAAVVAAPAAFADVKITGTVEAAFTAIENGNLTNSSDNNVAFSASEDLGNGLSAFAKIMLDTDNSSTNSKDNVVGLKGGFGTVVVGRMEGITRSKLSSSMTFVGAGGATGDGTNTVEGNIEGTATSGRDDSAWAYITPTMNGLHAAVAGYADNATDIAVFYDNGPLSLAVAQTNNKSSQGTGAKDEKDTTIKASYSMGDVKATVLWADVQDGGGVANTDATDIAYRLDYKMGNNTISVAYLDNETESTTAAGRDAAVKNVLQAEIVHSFSKRTKAYAAYTQLDHATNSSDVDTFTVGLSHSF